MGYGNENGNIIVNVAKYEASTVYVDEPRFGGNIQAAIDATDAYGTLVFDPKKSYVFEGVNITKPMHVKCNLASIKGSTTSGNSIFNINGVKSITTYKLSANVLRGDKSLVLTAVPSDIAAGDLIALYDDKARSDGTPLINTELHEVLSVTSATITLKDFVRLPKTASATANVFKITPIEDVTITGLNCSLQEGNTTGGAVYSECVRNLHVSSVKTTRTAGTAVYLKYAYLCTVDGFQIKDPQLTGSGQGYGIRCAKASGITIRDGSGSKMRHLVDFHNCFDGYVDNVIATNSVSTSFFLSHNSFDSDIAVSNCRSYGGTTYGFTIDNQGVTDPHTAAVYNINLTNCFAQSNPVSVAHAFLVAVPIKDSVWTNVTAICGTGNTATLLNAGGFYFSSSTDNDITIINAISKGFNGGAYVYELSGTAVAQSSPEAGVRFRNLRVYNTQYAIQANYGTGKILEIDGLTCVNVAADILRAGGGTYKRLVLKNVQLINSPGNVLQSAAIVEAGGATGEIADITSNAITSNAPLTVIAGKILSNNEMYLNQKGNCLPITAASAVTLGTTALPDGVVEGYATTILNTGANAITVPVSAKIITKSGANAVLATNQSLSLTWFSGAWREV